MWVGEADRTELLSFAFAPDGAALYTGDDSGGVLAWDRHTREAHELYRVPPFHQQSQPVWQLVIGTKPNRLFIPTANKVHVLRLPGGELVHTLHGTAPVLPHLDLTPNGRRFVCASADWHACVYDTKTWSVGKVPGALGQLRGVFRAILFDNAKRVLVFRSPDTEVSVWNAKTGEQERVIAKNEIWCQVCAMAPDRSAFAACTQNGTDVCVYNLPDWTLRLRIAHERKVAGLAFHPSGNLLALTDGTKAVSLWNTGSGAKIAAWNWRIGNVRAVCFAPDGLTCAVGGFGKFAVFDVDV